MKTIFSVFLPIGKCYSMPFKVESQFCSIQNPWFTFYSFVSVKYVIP